MPDAAPLEPGDPRSLGRYEVVGRLGAGGQGAVYLARTPEHDLVAIKLLHAQMATDPAARARFTREVAAAQKVAPFCTARVIEADVHGDIPYVVSEYIEGPSLHDLVAGQGPLDRLELERLAIGTVTALAAIHQAGIVHRDFKPNNVMIAPDGPRVVDFGIARTVNSQESKVTATGLVVGTPGYLAPEQLTGVPLQPSVDIFAWGAIMVFAATGRSPFEADTLPVIIHRILNQDPDLSALHGPLRDVVGRCLSKDPALRPPATQLLLQLLDNAGVAPGPAPGREELLGQGTRMAAQLPAPSPVATPAPAPRTPPMPLGMPGPATPPPTPMAGPRTPPPMAMQMPGPGTPPPMYRPMRPPMTLPPFQQMPYRQPPYQQPRKSNTGLFVGLGCGALVLLVVLILVVLYAIGRNIPTPAPTAQYTSPSSSGANGTAGVPAGYDGTWSGKAYTPDFKNIEIVKIILVSGATSAQVEYSGYKTCSALLTVQSVTDLHVVFTQTVTTGRAACKDGYVTLKSPGFTLDEYQWSANADGTSPGLTGVLTKQ